MALVPTIKDNDWRSARQAIASLTSLRLGPGSVPTFAGLKLTGLTSGRVPIISTGGLFSDDSLFTFDPATHALTISGLTFDAGSITDATGAISFGNENLSTTGTFGAGAITGTILAATAADGLTLGTDAATNIAGKIKLWSAGAVDWSTTLTAGVQTADANYTLPLARPTANLQALLGTNADPSVLSWGTDFGANNLSTTGTLGAGAITSSTLTDGKLPVVSTAGLLINSAGTGFVKVTSGAFSYDNSTYLTSVTPHNLLSTTHGDTTAAACARGSIIVGDSNTKWVNLVFPATPTGKVLQATATDVEWSANALGTGAFATIADYATLATPIFTSKITIGAAAGTTGSIELVGTTSGKVTLTANAAAGTPTYVFPSAVGAAGTVLTDAAGNGILSWAAGGGVESYSDLSALDGGTDVTGAELEELTDGSETTLHSHAGGGSGHVYVDRGDPAAFDFTLANFTTDGSWRDLNLSAIVTDATATVVHLRVGIKNPSAGQGFYLRKNGNSNSVSISGLSTQVATLYINNMDVWVQMDANRIIEYLAPNASWNNLDIVIKGWLKPA